MPRSLHQPHENRATVRAAASLPTAGTPEAFRSMMRCFPTGVAVVTTIDLYGEPRGMTCTSLTSVTLSPPTVLVCLNRDSGTSHAMRHRGAFAVNLLHGRAQETARLFAGQCSDRFNQLHWHRSRQLGLPLLDDDAFINAVCSVHDSTEVGDHDVIFGRVHEIQEYDDAPLLHGMQEFRTWSHLEGNGPAKS